MKNKPKKESHKALANFRKKVGILEELLVTHATQQQLQMHMLGIKEQIKFHIISQQILA